MLIVISPDNILNWITTICAGEIQERRWSICPCRPSIAREGPFGPFPLYDPNEHYYLKIESSPAVRYDLVKISDLDSDGVECWFDTRITEAGKKALEMASHGCFWSPKAQDISIRATRLYCHMSLSRPAFSKRWANALLMANDSRLEEIQNRIMTEIFKSRLLEKGELLNSMILKEAVYFRNRP